MAMIDLPDHGYSSNSLRFLDAGGVVSGSMGGPSEIIDRPGLRYSLQITTGLIRGEDATTFVSMLEQGFRDEVSYPFPLDRKAPPSASSSGVTINGAASAGALLPLKGLVPYYSFRQGQALAVVVGGVVGYVHKVAAGIVASSTGTASVPVFPWTRSSFADGTPVEIERPRIRGVLAWDGSGQSYFNGRSFTFTITEAQ